MPEKFNYPEYDIEAIIANHLIAVGEKTPKLKERYGDDFNSFLYRPGLDTFIKLEVLPFLALPEQYNGFLDYDHWMKKHPFNFPGPFYTGESDTCGTGDAEAPLNVMYDSYYCEYIFKQPKSFAELLCVFDAAAVSHCPTYRLKMAVKSTLGPLYPLYIGPNLLFLTLLAPYNIIISGQI